MNGFNQGWPYGFPLNVDGSENFINPYETSELEPVATYRHAEGPESLRGIRILDGESLLFDIPFDGSQADENWILYDIDGLPFDGVWISLFRQSSKHNFPFQKIVGTIMFVEWEESESFCNEIKVDLPDRLMSATFIERYADHTNPKFYILVGGEA